MALSRSIQEILMAVLDITQYELVVTSKLPGTTRYISAVQ